ncbi:MAG TPA: S8 family peptidase [Candidatus Aenigmarchaeota archaeon]|nr:S8 family peptidase [Candidatus Aenigmarchaeota archaeon]
MIEHLKLPFYEREFERKKRGGGRIKPREERRKFSEVQIFNLGKIKHSFEEDKRKFSKFFDPNLIFRIELNQNVDEEEFKKFLERSHIKVISPSPEGKGFWISLAEDESLEEVKKRLAEYGEKERYKQFDAIESFQPIPKEEKIGEQLKENPLEDEEEAYLDIEVWRMEDDRLQKFLKGFEELLSSNKGRITDKFITENLCLLRVKINKSTFKEIIRLREICQIDRPPKPYITFQILSLPLEKFEVGESPPSNATAIAILDSGILSNHPLLEKAVGDEIAVPLLSSDKIKEEKPQDDVGHGTKVAGIALYGDVKRCIEEKRFNPEIWILSAKVMYKNDMGEAEYNPEELLEHQLERSVRYFVENYPNCKVVNISLGDKYKKMFGNKRQFPLATLIDELAKELDIIFVISAGNLNPEENGYPNRYPNYLIEETPKVKIIDPASSAYAITVGAVSQEFGPSDRRPQEILFSPAKENYPSPFTCVGLGYKGMIKPELVEEGGNIIYSPSDPLKMEDIGGKLVVINPDWLKDGKLFTVAHGTSFSAPKVSHYLAKLFNFFPDRSPNLIKALLLASAEIPDERPQPLSDVTFNDSDTKLLNLLKVYGYGKPNFERAISSETNDVLLIAENRIKPNSIHLYYFYLPREFIEQSGKREISVVLVYNPPVRRNRIDYLGVSMEFHLFKDSNIEEIIYGYRTILKTGIHPELEDIVPGELKLKEIDLHPGVRTRKKGLHQKGIKIYSKRPYINHKKPLILTVISQDRWVNNPEYLQDYAIVVKIKHTSRIDIYNQIKQKLEIGERIRIRP